MTAVPGAERQALWKAVLEQLQLQTTRATFETWLKLTIAIGQDEDGTLIVGTPSAYGIEWLSSRLDRLIRRTLEQHGHTSGVRYIVAPVVGSGEAELQEIADEHRPPRAAPPPPLELVEHDPARFKWIKTSGYHFNFWLPHLDLGPFTTWQTVRWYAEHTEKWPPIYELAAIVAKGNRQLLTGRADRPDAPGWFEILEREQILSYELRGKQPVFQVLDSLPLLTPQQVDMLPKILRDAHARYLDAAKLDLEQWRRVTQLTLADVDQHGKFKSGKKPRRGKSFPQNSSP